MSALAEMEEYLKEIREEVCSRCVERPPGGPPCGALGKPCGVEMHLEKLVDAVREVHSELIAPYLDNTRSKICEGCAFLHSSSCPCPMDYLAVLVVEAIEAVDRRGRRGRTKAPVSAASALEEATRAYEEAVGTWTGCDWHTAFGMDRLNLGGQTAAEARARAAHAASVAEGETWAAAARWLAEVERKAQQAQEQATLAVAAANAGDWHQAVSCARRAWALEFATGRPLRHYPPAWQRLYEVIAALAPFRELPDVVEVR
jgi:hypothetical protein